MALAVTDVELVPVDDPEVAFTGRTRTCSPTAKAEADTVLPPSR